MKQGYGKWIGIGAIALLLIWAISSYNGMVNQKNNVEKFWTDLQASYQRRADLIPNLVETVKAVADKEKGTFTEIAGLRSGVLDAQKTLKDPGASEEAKIAAMQKVDQAKSFIMNINVENYPTLKFPDNFKDLQAELAGTENRILSFRTDYNDAVKEYNNTIQKFPGNLMAGMFGFTSKKGFVAQPGAENAPKVKF